MHPFEAFRRLPGCLRLSKGGADAITWSVISEISLADPLAGW